MLGSNTALTRQAVIRAGSFGWEARTGTDYALACKLRQVGVTIRFVRTSRMPVGLATNLRDYSRQRSRWLRNLVLVGRRFGDWTVVRQGVQPMLVGIVFVLLPLAPGRLRRPALVLWLLALLTGCLSDPARPGRVARSRGPLRVRWPSIRCGGGEQANGSNLALRA